MLCVFSFFILLWIAAGRTYHGGVSLRVSLLFFFCRRCCRVMVVRAQSQQFALSAACLLSIVVHGVYRRTSPSCRRVVCFHDVRYARVDIVTHRAPGSPMC